MKKTISALILAAALTGSASASFADSHGSSPGKAEDVAYDVLIARPAAWAYFAAGLTVYVPAAVVTQITGKETASLQEELVNKRYRYAAERPWGRF